MEITGLLIKTSFILIDKLQKRYGLCFIKSFVNQRHYKKFNH